MMLTSGLMLRGFAIVEPKRAKLWLQAAIETTHRDHSLIACSHHLHLGAILSAHPVRGALRIQHRACRVEATVATNQNIRTWMQSKMAWKRKGKHDHGFERKRRQTLSSILRQISALSLIK